MNLKHLIVYSRLQVLFARLNT